MRAKKVQEKQGKYQYWFACPSPSPDEFHQAFYFTEKPVNRVVNDDTWFATYKAVGDPYFEGKPVCQVCLERGIRRPCNVHLPQNRAIFTPEELAKHPFTIYGRAGQRHLRKSPSDPEEFKETPVLMGWDD